MKLLFVLEYFSPHVGGVETLFKSLTDQLNNPQNKITVITQRHDSSLERVESFDNLTIRRYNFYNRYLFTILAFFPAIYYARANDLIHTTSYNAAIPAFFAGLFTRKPVIITFHEYWGDLWNRLPFMGQFQKILHKGFENFLIKLPFKKFIAVSEFTKKQLVEAGVDPERVVRIYNGVDYSQFDGFAKTVTEGPTPFRFVYFGRLGMSKGIDILLSGCHHLLKTEDNFTLDLVIPKEPRKLYESIHGLIQEYNLSSLINIQHALSQDKLFDLVVSTDAVVVPSYSEGFGFTAAESVALGMPIISSHQGSLPEVVQGKYLIIDPFDGAGLKEAMAKAIKGEWQFKKIQKFEITDFVDQHLRLYKELMFD